MRKRELLIGTFFIVAVSLCACGGEGNTIENKTTAESVEKQNNNTIADTTTQDELNSTLDNETTSATENTTTNDVAQIDTSNLTTTTENVANSEKHQETTTSKRQETTTQNKEYATTVNKETQKSKIVQNVINQIITNNMTELQKVKAIHDYMVINIDYDKVSYDNGKCPESSCTVEGVLTGKYAICEGYARTFMALCNAVGIECEYVSGTGNGGSHAWNQVRVDGKWYNVDVTWDDPIKIDGESFDDHSHNRYNYFLVSDEVMYKNHSTKNAKHICTDSLYFEVLKMGIPWCDYVYIETAEDFKKAVVEKVGKNATEMRFFIKEGVFEEDKMHERFSMDRRVKEAIAECDIYDDYDVYYTGIYPTDEFGVFRCYSKIKLKDGVFTKIEPISNEKEMKEKILRLSEDLKEDKEVKFYLTNELAKTDVVNSDISKRVFYEYGVFVCPTGKIAHSDKVTILLIHFERVTENSGRYYSDDNAFSYDDVEMYIKKMIERGDEIRCISLYIRDVEDDGKIGLEQEVESLAKEMEEKYGLIAVVDFNNTGDNDAILYFRKL